jgi:hypothetical protein
MKAMRLADSGAAAVLVEERFHNRYLGAMSF